MSGIYNIGLYVVAFRTGSSGQVLVFFYTHNDNSMCSDSFTVFGLWVLGLAVTHIYESNCKVMSPEHYF